MHRYLAAKGRIQGDDVSIPKELQKYFVKEDLQGTGKSNGSKAQLAQSESLGA